ncbi:MAG: hypothetical protein ABSB71_10010 [Candidatus Bathyarchaeia archaeon]
MEAKKINKKRLALIVLVATLIIVALALAFTQPLSQNSKSASNNSPSLPSTSSQIQSLTQDEIATLKADSFEIELKDLISGSSQMSFGRIDTNFYNSTFIAKETAQFANYTSVSETTILGFIYDYLSKFGEYGNGPSFSILRVGNTFYFTISSFAYPQDDISVSCTP